MKKIIFFDSWTKSEPHISKLKNKLEDLGYCLLLLHTGSFKHEKGRKREEYINGLLVRDISFYCGKSFFEILELEKPSIIVFFSLKTPIHMAVNRYAIYFGIPTCHLYHGFATVQTYSNANFIKENKSARLINIFGGIYSSFRYSIPIYIYSMIKTGAKLFVWIEFIKFLLSRFFGIDLNKKYFHDYKTTLGCVYTNADIKHMNKSYGVDIKKIYPIGNPDFIKFKLKSSEIGFMLNKKSNKNIIYIDSGYQTISMKKKKINLFIEHIEKIKQKVEEIGFNFLIKTKPHSDFMRNGGQSILKSKGIQICNENNFIFELKNCNSVICEHSSLSMIPAALGLPIYLVSFGIWSGHQYSKILTSYPRSIKLNSLSNLQAHSSLYKKNDYKKYYKWIEKFLHPLPAEEMSYRFVKAIENFN